MPTIANIGASPGLGRAIARKFGQTATASHSSPRNAEKLNTLATELNAEGMT